MKLFVIALFCTITMAAVSCNSSTTDHRDTERKADSTAPVEGGSYNKDTTSYERHTDTAASSHH